MITFKQYFEAREKIQLEDQEKIDLEIMETGTYKEKFLSKESINKSIERLKEIIIHNSRVGYYPSSGLLIDVFDFSELPLVYIICSDYDIKDKGC